MSGLINSVMCSSLVAKEFLGAFTNCVELLMGHRELHPAPTTDRNLAAIYIITLHFD